MQKKREQSDKPSTHFHALVCSLHTDLLPLTFTACHSHHSPPFHIPTAGVRAAYHSFQRFSVTLASRCDARTQHARPRSSTPSTARTVSRHTRRRRLQVQGSGASLEWEESADRSGERALIPSPPPQVPELPAVSRVRTDCSSKGAPQECRVCTQVRVLQVV